ncbi:MAG: response regulator [Deltaproteobacteria bacterium]|nr:response regulator [Deltaproteobacteria bacterium]
MTEPRSPAAGRWLALAPEAWRGDLLRVVLRVTAILGGLVCIPSVYLSVQEGLYGIVVLDTVSLAVVLALSFFDRLPDRLRAVGACLVYYVLGAGLLVGVGSISQMYLFGFSILTTLLLGFRPGLASAALNAATLLAIGWLSIAAPPEMVVPRWIYSIQGWTLITLNFAMVNVSLVLALGAVVSALETALGRALEEVRDRKLAEARRDALEEQLRQAQKMEAIGNLAGGVAHDFNNLLSVILGYADMLIEPLDPEDPARADLQEIRNAGQRAAALTSQLLAFSRKQILQPVVLDLNEVVRGVQRLVGRLLPEDIALTIATCPDEARIHADAGQIEQVLVNLVINARDAMPNGGRLSIATANGVLRDPGSGAPATWVELRVTDSGVGMDRATRERAFEPFFTTKDKSKGTGLGLSTVYGIVQQSGGHVDVESEPGHGTTFRILLPHSEGALEVSPVRANLPIPSARGTETILLVEDEAQVRKILGNILRKQGYDVLEADCGPEALLRAAQSDAEIHLLVTDVVMPGMSGRTLAEQLVALRPGLRVLFVSGYTEDAILRQGVLFGGIELLPKPIVPDALVQRVRQVLDAPPGPRTALRAVDT